MVLEAKCLPRNVPRILDSVGLLTGSCRWLKIEPACALQLGRTLVHRITDQCARAFPAWDNNTAATGPQAAHSAHRPRRCKSRRSTVIRKPDMSQNRPLKRAAIARYEANNMLCNLVICPAVGKKHTTRFKLDQAHVTW